MGTRRWRYFSLWNRSCASAAMSFEKGLTGREVDVELYLGTLHISYLEDGTVLMTGPAEEVFETELPID